MVNDRLLFQHRKRTVVYKLGEDGHTAPLDGKVGVVAGCEARRQARNRPRSRTNWSSRVLHRAKRHSASLILRSVRTIEETAAMIAADGGTAIALRVDRTGEAEVEAQTRT